MSNVKCQLETTPPNIEDKPYVNFTYFKLLYLIQREKNRRSSQYISQKQLIDD